MGCRPDSSDERSDALDISGEDGKVGGVDEMTRPENFGTTPEAAGVHLFFGLIQGDFESADLGHAFICEKYPDGQGFSDRALNRQLTGQPSPYFWSGGKAVPVRPLLPVGSGRREKDP
jgi:hypothetical protein